MSNTTGDVVGVVEAKIKADLSWLQKHERLALSVVAGLVLWFAIGKIDTLIANHDNAHLQQVKVEAAVQQEKNDALTKQAAQYKADYDVLAAKIDARDEQLHQLQAQLNTTLAKQQKTDAAMTTPEIAQRWEQLVPAATVSPTSTGGVALTDAGAHATVEELEKAPVLEQQLSAKDEELSNANKLVAAEGQQLGTLNDLVAGLRTKAMDDAKVCSAQIAVVKAEARKGKRHWFYAGMVVGWVGRQVVKTYTGF